MILINLYKSLPKLVLHRSISTTYNVRRNKVQDSYSILLPYIDFSTINPEDMTKNLSHRQMNINFSDIDNKFYKWKNLKKKKLSCMERREEIAQKMRNIENKSNHEIVEKLKHEGKIIREELKLLKEEYHMIEEDFIKDFLKLPNTLDHKTPERKSLILYQNNLRVENDTNHKINLNQLNEHHFELINNNVYLKNEAALFELYFPQNSINYFLKNDFIQFINPDFCRNILLEVTAYNTELYHQIEEHINSSEENGLNLIGGGSFLSFLGFVTKLSVFPSALPLKFITSGRQYIFQKDLKRIHGNLCRSRQNNTVNSFIACKDVKGADEEFEKLLNFVVEIYNKLNVDFRIVYVEAKELFPAESLRISIQMFFSSDEFIEVGRISKYTDYISKRILFNFKDGSKYEFPHIVAGTIADTLKIISCLLENDKPLKIPQF